MTLDQLLDEVPWIDMGWRRSEALAVGLLRHQRTGACPIVAVLGGRHNAAAIAQALAAGVPSADVARLMAAADGHSSHLPEVRALREAMAARIVAARQLAEMGRQVEAAHAEAVPVSV